MCRRWEWVNHEDYDNTQELSVEEFQRLFDELAVLGIETVLFTGGEPTAHPSFVDLVEGATGAGLSIAMLSNGVGITEQLANCIDQHMDWTRISLDDVPFLAARRVRSVLKTIGLQVDSPKRTVTEEACASLANLLSARMSHDGNHATLGVGFTIQKTNVYHVPRMIDWISDDSLARALDLRLELKVAHGTGPFVLDQLELQWLQDNVITVEEYRTNAHANVPYLGRLLETFGAANIATGLPTLQLYQSRRCSCFVPYMFSLIDAFGKVYVCCHWYDDNGTFESDLRERNCIGSIRDATFEEIWNGQSYNSVRQNLAQVDPGSMPCGACTRHWSANLALSAIYNHVFIPLVDKYGPDHGEAAYQSLLSGYPEGQNVWM